MIISCSSCQKKNRVPAARLHQEGKCGACQAALKTNTPLDVDAASFDEIVAAAQVPILVDFWASWCGPCVMAAPAVKQVAADLAGRALVLKVDTEAHPRLSQRFGIRGIPHFMVFKDGKPAFEQSGVVGADVMKSWLA